MPTTPLETQVYRYAADRGEISSVDPVADELGVPRPTALSAVTRLVELRLLRTDGERLVPVEPGAAVSTLVSPIEHAIYERLDAADRLREQIAAIADDTTTRVSPSAIDGLEGPAEIRGLFKLAADGCREEIAVLRPSNFDEELLDDLLSPCYSALEEPVSMRVLCSHRSRAGFAFRALARCLKEQGAEIRTLSEVPHAAVVFDRSVAVLLCPPEGGGQPSARQVRDPDVIGCLLDLFAHLWETSTPYGTEDAGYADAIDDLQQSIVQLMAQGLTDEVVARRLGMSVRTCRRHIATLLDNLGSVSRFQAGYQAAARLAALANPA